MAERFVVQANELAGLQVITRQPIVDARGWFERAYCADTFAELGINKTISQINRSFTVQKGSVRGISSSKSFKSGEHHRAMSVAF